MKKTIHRIILGTGLLLSAAGASASWRQLNVPETIQEHSNWCWAGTSKAILNYYGTAANQCNIVNWAFGINYACGNGDFNWNSNANQPNAVYGTGGSVQNILQSWGNLSNTAYAYASSWDALTWDINNNRPFVIRYGWTNGGGHILVGDGWESTNGTSYVYLMNPWPGEGQTYSTYAYTVSSSDHRWTHTLRMNR